MFLTDKHIKRHFYLCDFLIFNRTNTEFMGFRVICECACVCVLTHDKNSTHIAIMAITNIMVSMATQRIDYASPLRNSDQPRNAGVAKSEGGSGFHRNVLADGSVSGSRLGLGSESGLVHFELFYTFLCIYVYFSKCIIKNQVEKKIWTALSC